MDDEKSIVSNGVSNFHSGSEGNSETGTVTETIVYTDQLQIIQDYQSLQIGLECVMIGVLLMLTVFNVLKRYF